MATVKKSRGRWTARVRRKSGYSLQKTFDTKKEAIAWGATQDLALEQGRLSAGETHCFSDVATLYLSHISPNKALTTHYKNQVVLRKLCQEPWTKRPLHDLTFEVVNEWRQRRSAEVTDNTIRTDIALIRSVARSAAQFDIHLDLNIFQLLHKPASTPRVPDRLTEDDMKMLEMAAFAVRKRNTYIGHLIRLAVETGMRRGELLNIDWKDVHIDRGFIIIPAAKTKNRRQRDIPLTPKARAVLEERRSRFGNQERVFMETGNAVRKAFERLREAAGFPDLHFHDFRHECVSRLYDVGLTTPEVMAVSGHRCVDMVELYSHASTTNLVAKLQGGLS